MKKTWLFILFYTYALATLIMLPLEATLVPVPQPAFTLENERITIAEDFYIKALTPQKESLLSHLHKHFQEKPGRYIHGIFNPQQLATYIPWSDKDENFARNINNLISFVVTSDNKAIATILAKKNDHHVFNIPFSFDKTIGIVKKKNEQQIDTDTIIIVLTHSVKNNKQLKIKTIYPIEKKSSYNDTTHLPLKIKKHNNEELISYVNKTLNKEDSSFNKDLEKFEKTIHNLETKLKNSYLNQKTEDFFKSYQDFLASLANSQHHILQIQNEITTIANDPQFNKNMSKLMAKTSNEEAKYRQKCSRLKKRLKEETKNLTETRGSSTHYLKENIQQTQEKIDSLKNLYSTQLFIPQAEQAKIILNGIMSRFNVLQIQLEDINKDENHKILDTKPHVPSFITAKIPIWAKLYAIEKTDNYQALRNIIIEQEELTNPHIGAAKIAELYDNAMQAICELTTDKKIQNQMVKTLIEDLSITQTMLFCRNITKQITAPLFKSLSSLFLNFYSMGLALFTKQKHILKFIKKIGGDPVVSHFCFLTTYFSKDHTEEDIYNQSPTFTFFTPFINESITSLKNLNLPGNKINKWAIYEFLHTIAFNSFVDEKFHNSALKIIYENKQQFIEKIQKVQDLYENIKKEHLLQSYKSLLSTTLNLLNIRKAFLPIGSDAFNYIIGNLIPKKEKLNDIETIFLTFTQTITPEEKIKFHSMLPSPQKQEQMLQEQQTILANLDFTITLLREQKCTEGCFFAGFCKKIFEYSPSTKIATEIIIELLKINGQKTDPATTHALKLIRQLSHNQHESSAKHIWNIMQKKSNPSPTITPLCSRIISFLQTTITTLASLKDEKTAPFITINAESIIWELFNKNIKKDKTYINKQHFDATITSIPDTIKKTIMRKIMESRSTPINETFD